ncbi:unnamed protein product [Priceomyces carsonii]|nr:unnamed protein product [Priceomyces carsonii]
MSSLASSIGRAFDS